MTMTLHPMPRINVRAVDYSNPRDAAALLELLDSYAQDCAGGGKPLQALVKHGLVQVLHKRQPQAFSAMAWSEGPSQHPKPRWPWGWSTVSKDSRPSPASHL